MELSLMEERVTDTPVGDEETARLLESFGDLAAFLGGGNRLAELS
jgi:hypothetical protein